jgi:hypothetical protein
VVRRPRPSRRNRRRRVPARLLELGSSPALKVADIARYLPSVGFGAILLFGAFGASR